MSAGLHRYHWHVVPTKDVTKCLQCTGQSHKELSSSKCPQCPVKSPQSGHKLTPSYPPGSWPVPGRSRTSHEVSRLQQEMVSNLSPAVFPRSTQDGLGTHAPTMGADGDGSEPGWGLTCSQNTQSRHMRTRARCRETEERWEDPGLPREQFLVDLLTEAYVRRLQDRGSHTQGRRKGLIC